MDKNEFELMLPALINQLVRDEWEAIEGYNSTIATLAEWDLEEAAKIKQVLEDIRDEEYLHVGQLESCLSVLTTDPTEDIEDGSEEGLQQLELPEDDEEEEEKKAETSAEEEHEQSGISEDEMKNIICSMITKYDASEEETFDEIQSQDPTVSRDAVHRLYVMCSGSEEEESEEDDFDFETGWLEMNELED